MSSRQAKAIFQLKVTLRDIDPPIWRSVQTPEDTRLPRLHRIVQLLFSWEDYHLHEFTVGRHVYGIPDPEDARFGLKVRDERLLPLNRILYRVGETFEYRYDFGDNWRHDILLEAILLPSPEASCPRCVAGARNAPPEDVGGTWGYSSYLEALADPEHDQHDEKLLWRGSFDAEEFSIQEINASLKRNFQRRKPRGRESA